MLHCCKANFRATPKVGLDWDLSYDENRNSVHLDLHWFAGLCEALVRYFQIFILCVWVRILRKLL